MEAYRTEGKDSTAVLNLALTALKELQMEGVQCPPLAVLHADTLVENPEMAAHAHKEMDAIRAYADHNHLNVIIKVSQPSLLSQWVVKVVSGRNLPVFANKGTRDCTIDLKIGPMNSVKSKIMKDLRATHDLPPVTCLGTRFLESTGRAKRMTERGETSEGTWMDESGELMLSPIANWNDAVLWTYLYECSQGTEEAYGDLSELIRVYMAGTPETSCVDGVEIPACRFGCSICTVGRDRSLEAMLAKDERYSYMQPLYDLQRFLVNTQHDFTLRQWVGRSINHGFVRIHPDTYSPAMLENLLRYMLTIDVREKEAAYRRGLDEPRFELVSAKALIAIDAIWSQQGIHKSFHALSIYRDVYVNGMRYDIPTTQPGKPAKLPEPRYIEVGQGWEDRSGKFEFCGLRDVHLEAANEGAATGCMGHKTLKDGRVVLNAETSDSSFDINDESIEFILGFEVDYLIDLGRRMPRSYGFKHYVQMGAINMAKSQFSSTDMILRRTSFKEFEGIFAMSLKELLEVTESADEMRAKLAAKTRKGEVGGEYAAGGQVATSTNRLTTPFPVDSDDAAAWLLENALQEARGRKDAKAKKMFGAAAKEPSRYAAEMAEVYLFGSNIETAQPMAQDIEDKPTAKVIPLPMVCEEDRQPARWVQLSLLAA